MGLDFEFYDSENYTLDYAIYVLQCVGCFLVTLPFCFVLHCLICKPNLRCRRTLFTTYLTSIDFIGRSIYFVYYVLRLAILDERIQKIDVDRIFCDWLMFFLLNASVWPLTSAIVLQIHALFAASVRSYDIYEKLVSIKVCFLTIALSFLIDLAFCVIGYHEIYDYSGENVYKSGCKFEYYSRFTHWNGWKIVVELVLTGFLATAVIVVRIIKKRRRTVQEKKELPPDALQKKAKQKDEPNPAANSPFHNYHLMNVKEKCLTSLLFSISVVGFLLFIATYVVFLLEGNSQLCRILMLSITIFSFITPVQMIWLNAELRDELLKIIFGNKRRKSIAIG